MDNWLSQRGIVGDSYIEIWGVKNDPRYTERKNRKIELCRQHNLKLVQIHLHQFAKGRKWWLRLEALLPEEAAGVLF